MRGTTKGKICEMYFVPLRDKLRVRAYMQLAVSLQRALRNCARVRARARLSVHREGLWPYVVQAGLRRACAVARCRVLLSHVCWQPSPFVAAASFCSLRLLLLHDLLEDLRDEAVLSSLRLGVWIRVPLGHRRLHTSLQQMWGCLATESLVVLVYKVMQEQYQHVRTKAEDVLQVLLNLDIANSEIQPDQVLQLLRGAR